MAEGLRDSSNAAPAAQTSRRVQRYLGIGYQLAMGLGALALLLSRTRPGQLSPYDWLLFGIFLLVSILCEELGFTLGTDELTVSLGGLFYGAAVLTLGFNGVWVPLLSNLYWLTKTERRRWRAAPPLNQLSLYVFNLSMNALPAWLALFVYHDLLDGQIPLADLGGNLLPVLAFVVVHWLVLLAGVTPLIVIATQGVRGAAQWFKGIMAGFALTVYVSLLFSPAVAVLLNRLGLGFFLFVTVGLLIISLMAQRLARSLVSEQQRVKELAALNLVSDDIIHSPPSVAATGELLVRHAPRFIPGADFELCLFGEEDPKWRQPVVVWRDGAAQPGSDAPLTPPWAWLRAERLPLLVSDLEQEALPFTWDATQDGSLPGSLLLVPLLAGDQGTPKEVRCIGGILMSHDRRGVIVPDTLPSMTALANQLAAAVENARLHQDALARERLERELALARGIQTSFLPADVPHIAGWSFVASLEPARHVSGDFYDFIPLPGDRLGLLVADVADKGMPAALYMALARTLIRAHAQDHTSDPAACLVAANDQILTDTRSDLFVTVFYAILDPATGETTFANAGHPPPFLCHREGRPAEPLPNTGMALGVLPGVAVDNGRLVVAPGDVLVLYTDGVTDAHDSDLSAFGRERLLDAAEAAEGKPAADIHRQILDDLDRFTGGSSQFDDLTLVVLSREPLQRSQEP